MTQRYWSVELDALNAICGGVVLSLVETAEVAKGFGVGSVGDAAV